MLDIMWQSFAFSIAQLCNSKRSVLQAHLNHIEGTSATNGKAVQVTDGEVATSLSNLYRLISVDGMLPMQMR